jgi:hypothetical protein
MLETEEGDAGTAALKPHAELLSRSNGRGKS